MSISWKEKNIYKKNDNRIWVWSIISTLKQYILSINLIPLEILFMSHKMVPHFQGKSPKIWNAKTNLTIFYIYIFKTMLDSTKKNNCFTWLLLFFLFTQETCWCVSTVCNCWGPSGSFTILHVRSEKSALKSSQNTHFFCSWPLLCVELDFALSCLKLHECPRK